MIVSPTVKQGISLGEGNDVRDEDLCCPWIQPPSPSPYIYAVSSQEGLSVKEATISSWLLLEIP